MGRFWRQLGEHTAILAVLAGLAAACGDANLPGTARGQAQLVLNKGTTVHIGQVVVASLILPKDATLETGTMWRSGCSPFHFKVEPETGWHDPWADWHQSGIPKHASASDKPYQNNCGVTGGWAPVRITIVDGKVVSEPQPPPPPPQIGFLLNSWLEFDKPGKYTVSLTYRAKLSNGLGETWNENVPDSFVTLQTDPIEIEVLSPTVDQREQTVSEIVAGVSYPSGPDPETVLELTDQHAVVDALEAQVRRPGMAICGNTGRRGTGGRSRALATA